LIWKGISLFIAYKESPDPKPALSTLIDAIRKGDIRGESRDNVIYVPSSQEFSEDLTTWIEVTGWTSNGRSSTDLLPDGFVYISSFIQREVSAKEGVARGLLGEATLKGKFQLGSIAKAEIAAGALPSAVKVGGRGIWAAPRGEVIDWLFSSWGIEGA